ncbi:MAG: hypothetical protein ACHREM_05000 [Polyangiales bacterium]
MYVIHKQEGHAQKLIAAFALVAGRIVFDEARGDPAFVQALRERGLHVRRADGTVAEVLPEGDGVAFVDACLTQFNGVLVTCNDEDELAAARQRFDVDETSSQRDA